MKAVVFHGVGDIRLDTVPDPAIEAPTDAVIRITASAICGTDLHFVRGTVPGVTPGTILGHEAVGVVEEVGKDVRNLRRGDRVVVPSTIACGSCVYCRSGYYAQCDESNPGGPRAGTAFFGGPAENGGFNGLQAQFARVPFANVGLVKVPEGIADEQAIMVSDIFPTGYFGADLAEITEGDIVVVFGCGPVGLFTIASARLMGAGRVIAVDGEPSRLEAARGQNAEVIDFNEEDPVDAVMRLTHGTGADRAIDAVGVDAVSPARGPAKAQADTLEDQFAEQQKKMQVPQKDRGPFMPGNAPSIVPLWACEALAKAGTLSVIGVYPATHQFFPLGQFMNRNLTMKAGNCNHRKYIPRLLELVDSGVVDPSVVLTQVEPVMHAIDAYKAFDARQPGWIKVELDPQAAA